MSTIPRLTTRYHNRIELTYRNPAGVTQYRVSGHKTLNGAQAGSADMFTFNAGTQFRSPHIVGKGWGLYDECQRGLSRAFFSLDDYTAGNPNLPSSGDTAYLRFEDEFAGAWQAKTPILVVPPAPFFGTNSPSLTLSGTAPAISAVAGEAPPPTSMFIALPRTASSIEVHSLEAVGGGQLMVSFGEGISMAPILPVQSITSYGPTNFIALASGDAGTIDFTIVCSMDRF